MRGRFACAAFVLAFACRPEGGSTAPGDASSSSESDPASPSTPEDRGETGPAVQALLQIEGGGLTEAQAQNVIDDHFTDIRKCFDEALTDPDSVADMTAPIIVLVQVDAAGKVSESKLESSEFGSKPTEDCIVKRMSEWTFPAPKNKKPATLHVPFYLRSY